MIDFTFLKFKKFIFQLLAAGSLLVFLVIASVLSTSYFSENNIDSNVITGFVTNTEHSDDSPVNSEIPQLSATIDSPENQNEVTSSNSDSLANSDVERDIESGFFTPEEGVIMSSYDKQIITSCKKYNQNNVDCFYLLKSIMSVTSHGEPTYVDKRITEDWIGLVPLPKSLLSNEEYQNIFSSDSASSSETETDEYSGLANPEQNLDAAAKYIMQLYERYNGDLQFTLSAYLGGISLANELTRIFINKGGLTFRDNDITFEMILDNLQEAFESADKYHDMPLIYGDVKERFQNILHVYEFWSQKPMRASSPNEVLYEFGTYSVRPSFSAKTRFNVSVFEIMDETVKEFISDAQNKLSAKPDYSFSTFTTFVIDSDPESEAEMVTIESQSNSGAATNNNVALSQKGLLWYDTACTPAEAVFYKFVSRFVLCLESSQSSCDCSFSDLDFVEGYIIRVEQDMHESKKLLSFELLELNDDFEDEFTLAKKDLVFKTELLINYEKYPKLSLDAIDSKQSLDMYQRNDVWFANGVELSGNFGKRDVTGKTEVQFKDKRDNAESLCSLETDYQLYCVQDPKTFVYRKYPSGYRRVPLEYHFALGSTSQKTTDVSDVEEDAKSESTDTNVVEDQVSNVDVETNSE